MSKRSCESCQDEDNTGIDASLPSSRHTQSLCILYTYSNVPNKTQTMYPKHWLLQNHFAIQSLGIVYSTTEPFCQLIIRHCLLKNHFSIQSLGIVYTTTEPFCHSIIRHWLLQIHFAIQSSDIGFYRSILPFNLQTLASTDPFCQSIFRHWLLQIHFAIQSSDIGYYRTIFVLPSVIPKYIGQLVWYSYIVYFRTFSAI